MHHLVLHAEHKARGDSLEVYKRCLALRAFPVTDKVLKHPLFSWLLHGHECPWQMVTATGGWIWNVGETEKDFSLVGALTICQLLSQQKSATQKEVFGTSKSTALNDWQHISASVCTLCFKWLYCFLKEFFFQREIFICHMYFSFIVDFCFCGLQANYGKDSH